MSEDNSAGLAAEHLGSKYLSSLLENINTTQDHLAGNDGAPLSSSFLPPNAVWTPREKNQFFHALSVYSRFRPDLISYEIKTKSVSDVCNYLSVLQLAAHNQEDAVLDPRWRQNLPIAMEVSSEWVAMEEETSFGVIAREQDFQRELIAEQRRAELKSLERTFKAEFHDMEPSQRKAKLKQEIANANLRDRRKDFCGSLGSSELTAIGSILREATNSSGSSQTKQSPPSVADTQNPLSPVQRRPSSNGRLPLQRAKGRFQSCSPQPDSNTPLTELSPASRRRYQKRLYMRRKRASMSGVTTIDEGFERLKPGRKAKRSSSPEDEITDVEDNGDPILVHGADGLSATQKRYPRAMRLAIGELRDLGLTADDLRKLGLDVLKSEGVAKMLK